MNERECIEEIESLRTSTTDLIYDNGVYDALEILKKHLKGRGE